MKTLLKRSLCTIFSILTVFCTSISAFAAESPSSTNTFVPVEESSISRQEALDILGFTEEDIDGGEILVGDFEVSTLSSIDPSNPFDSGYFSFSGENIGSYRTLHGNFLGYTILWKPTEFLGRGAPTLRVDLYGYGSNKSLSAWQIDTSIQNPTMVGDYYRSPTKTLKIQDGLDYHFIYNSYHAYYDGYWPKDSRCSVRVIMVTGY